MMPHGFSTYIVYVDAEDIGYIQARSHNRAEQNASALFPGHAVSVAYTEVSDAERIAGIERTRQHSETLRTQ